MAREESGGDPVEREWLHWAREIVLADDHTDQCVADGGGTLEPGGVPSLRWPGYLGSGYRTGGLMLVANVHQSFSSNRVPAEIGGALVRAALRMRDDPDAPDSEYLGTTRAAYRSALGGRPRWRVAIPFQWMLDDLGVGWDDVAYTNAGKSQVGLDNDIDDVVAGCLERFPLSRLLEATRPAAVVTCSAQARDALAPLPVPSFYFRQTRPSKALVAEVTERVRPLIRLS